MRRFIGTVLAILGGVATLWGGYHCLTGQSNAQIAIVNGVSITSLMLGLVGVVVLVLGLIWVRD